jgi:hypothetical protein
LQARIFRELLSMITPTFLAVVITKFLYRKHLCTNTKL